MRRSLYIPIVGIFVISMFVASIFQQAHAATQGPQAGFSVSPAQLSFMVRADNPTQTKELIITNSYTSPLRLSAELQSIDEQGVRLVPNGPIDDQLQKAIKVSATDITVPAKGSYQLQIAIDGTWLSDGGHYVSLVLSQRSTISSNSGFRSAVAVNLFIIKNEHIRTNLQLISLSFDRPLLSLPKTVSLVLRNEGNTHIVPRASVIVYDGEDVVSKAVVNTNSTILLPNHEEKFTVKLDTYRRYWLPRRLIARTMYRIDGSDIQLMKEQVLWHIPFVDIIGILAAGFMAWRWRRSIRTSYLRLKKRAKAIYHSRKQKHAAKQPQSVHTHKVEPVTSEVKTINNPVEHVASVVQGQSEIPSRHITIQGPSSDAPKITTPEVKRITITLKEESAAAPSRSMPKKSTSRSKKQPAKKTKTPTKTGAKKSSKTVKKPAAKSTKKKSA
jgi:hypothetical protein